MKRANKIKQYKPLIRLTRAGPCREVNHFAIMFDWITTGGAATRKNEEKTFPTFPNNFPFSFSNSFYYQSQLLLVLTEVSVFGLPLLCTRIGDNRLGIGSETIRKISQCLQWCHFAGRRSPICEGDNNVVLKFPFEFWIILIELSSSISSQRYNCCASTISPPDFISVCWRFIIVKCFLLLHHPPPAFRAGISTTQCGTWWRCFFRAFCKYWIK